MASAAASAVEKCCLNAEIRCHESRKVLHQKSEPAGALRLSPVGMQYTFPCSRAAQRDFYTMTFGC